MNKRITIKDVARAADCSFVAVSRVLSGRDLNHVSLDVQKRVRDAAERLGYKPSQAARALRTGRTNTIGLVLGAFYNRMEGCVAHALMADAKKRGYDLSTTYPNMEGILGYEGEQYGYPCNVAVSSFLFNLNTLKKYDLSLPDEDWTTEDFERIAKKFMDRTKQGNARRTIFFALRTVGSI